jgi:glycosyltransferase involved in cell wall biosynthesis
MKIAILTPSFLPKFSGAEIFHHQLAVRLVEAGDEVTVVVPRKVRRTLEAKGWALPYDLAEVPGNFWSFFKRSEWLGRCYSGWFLRSLQRRFAFDVWHGVMFYPTAMALVPWARKAGVAHVVRSAGDDVIASRDGTIGCRREPTVDRLVGEAVRQAQAVVALSPTIEAEFARLGAAPLAVHLLPNAVDQVRLAGKLTLEERARIREKLGVSSEGLLFLAVGRNHPQKNYPVLLRALAGLAARAGEGTWQLLILGRDGAALEEEASAMGLRGRVVAREIPPVAASGQVPEFPPQELVEAYQAADVFVMPSLLEGFSTALLEAMAAGLPVITTDAPGCGDFVRQGQDALMVPAGELEPLQAALHAMLINPGLRAEWSARASARAAEFSWERVVTGYRNLYADLARQR